ncbi:hypothetical protein [Rubripirellula obstinata]|nr:hypothetical protein [Rubripirellula obstinata]
MPTRLNELETVHGDALITLTERRKKKTNPAEWDSFNDSFKLHSHHWLWDLTIQSQMGPQFQMGTQFQQGTQWQQGSGQQALRAARRAFSFANKPQRFFGAQQVGSGAQTGSGAGQQTGCGAGAQTGSGAGQQTGCGAGAQTGSGAGQQTGSGSGQQTGSGAGQHGSGAGQQAAFFLKQPNNPASAEGAVAKLALAINVKAKIIRTIGNTHFLSSEVTRP